MSQEKLRYRKTVITLPLVILNPNTESEILDCGSVQLVGLRLPSEWTTCDITFQASDDGVNFFDIAVSGSTSVVNLSFLGTVANQWIPVQPWLFAGIPFLKVVSSVTQSVDVEIGMIFQPLFQGIHE